MGKRKTTAKSEKPESPSAVCPFVKFTPETIHRSKLVGSEYNPRVMNDEERRLLTENIQRVGLIDGPIWNKRTGRLVGGHMRVGILDSLMGTQDYYLPVNIVDLDEKTEREQNIFLNNNDASGNWDIEKLGAMFKDGQVDANNAGFSPAVLYNLFGDSPLTAQPEQLDMLAAQMREARERYNSIKGAIQKRDDPDFYLVVFASIQDRLAWMDQAEIPLLNGNYTRYVDSSTLARAYQKLQDRIADLEALLAEQGAESSADDMSQKVIGNVE